jgi:Uma2 family endonuclease
MGHAHVASRFDLAGFLAWEDEQPDRHEWVDGEVFAMTGARDAHNRIALNFASTLKAALRGTPCRTFMADMKVYIEAADSVVYPDVFVTCDARDRSAEADLVKRHPTLVIEVISNSTGAYDRGRKFALYRSVASLKEVLFVEQDRMQVDLFRRGGDGRWVLYPAGATDQVELASLDQALSVASIYEDVLPAAAEEPPPP